MTYFIKHLYITIGLLLASASLVVNAATLIVPEAFDVLSVNGVDQSAFSLAKEKRLELKIGRNIVVLEYDEIFDSQLNDSHESVRSQAYALIFEITGENELILGSPDTPDLASAKRYAKNPTFDITDRLRQKITLMTKPAKDLTFATVLSSGDTSTMPAPQQESTALPNNATPRMPLETAPVAAPRVTAQPEALSMLMYWWRLANEQEREAFLNTIEQEKN